MFRKSLLIGAIILTGIMALNIYIPVIIVLSFFSLFITITKLYYLSKIYIILFLIILITGSLGVLRFRNSSGYEPFNIEELELIDLVVLNDSKKVEGGYITRVLAVKWYGSYISAKSHKEINLYSEYELFKGDTLNSVKFGRTISLSDSRRKVNGEGIRVLLLKALSRNIDSPLLFAMVTGNKNRLDKNILENFRKSGLSHILALSGFHLGIIILLVYLLLKFFLPVRVVFITTAAVLIFYIYIIGISPSLIRSFIMYLIGGGYKILKGRVDIKITFLSTYIISLLIFPETFRALSFLLSYLSLFGIIYISPMLISLKPLSLTPMIVGSSISVSLSATISTGVLLIIIFGEMFPIGILASTIISPIIVIYMFIGIGSILVAPLKRIIVLLDDIIYRICNFFSGFPSIEINDNIHFPTFILLSLPVILYLVTVLRSRNIGRFNAEFKL